MEVPEQPSNPISWDTIVGDNLSDDPLKYLFNGSETKEITRKPRGRPKKTPPTPPAEELPPQPTPEESIPSSVLTSMFMKTKSISPKQKKNTLRFSGEDKKPEEETPLDPDRVVLLKMYKHYFKLPLLSQHTRKERIWQDHHLNSEIFTELRLLETACSEDDPAKVLASMWVAGMVGVEKFGPIFDLRTENLGAVAQHASTLPHFQTNMRELLLKYPYLRTMIGLGGYPEFKLLMTTTTLIAEIHDMNQRQSSADPGPDPSQPLPHDLRKQFDGL
jgi:hypothetical protein